MMDILLKKTCTSLQIRSFLLKIFGGDCKVISLNDFNVIEAEIDMRGFHCLCVYSDTYGDAAQLLQLYRYTAEDVLVLNNIARATISMEIACFIPCDSFDGWVLVEGGKSQPVRRIESDDEKYYSFV